MIQIIMGVVIFNVLHIWNFVKARGIAKTGMALSRVDEELLKIVAPCKDIMNYNRTLRLKWLFFITCIAYFISMTVFDYFVFGE